PIPGRLPELASAGQKSAAPNATGLPRKPLHQGCAPARRQRSATNKSDRMIYGQYLVSLGGCGECHTPVEKGQPLPGKEFAGGQKFETTQGTVISANITTDTETGIGKWNEEYFLKKFYDYK